MTENITDAADTTDKTVSTFPYVMYHSDYLREV